VGVKTEVSTDDPICPTVAEDSDIEMTELFEDV
jgi:hypothetical protein